jgi:hypothetical protein
LKVPQAPCCGSLPTQEVHESTPPIIKEEGASSETQPSLFALLACRSPMSSDKMDATATAEGELSLSRSVDGRSGRRRGGDNERAFVWGFLFSSPFGALLHRSIPAQFSRGRCRFAAVSGFRPFLSASLAFRHSWGTPRPQWIATALTDPFARSVSLPLFFCILS